MDEVMVAGPEEGMSYKGKYGYPCECEIAFDEAKAADFDGVILHSVQNCEKCQGGALNLNQACRRRSS
jgi:hypothetical protein